MYRFLGFLLLLALLTPLVTAIFSFVMYLTIAVTAYGVIKLIWVRHRLAKPVSKVGKTKH